MWSFQKASDYLQSPGFIGEVSPADLLHKALFLVALTTGLRVSQLKELTQSLLITISNIGPILNIPYLGMKERITASDQ